jgi:hypothetical protein
MRFNVDIKTSNKNILKEFLIIGNRSFTFYPAFLNKDTYTLREHAQLLKSKSENFILRGYEVELYNIFVEEMRLRYEL